MRGWEEAEGRSAAKIALMAAPFGGLELPEKGRDVRGLSPKALHGHGETRVIAHSLSVSFDCDSSSEECRKELSKSAVEEPFNALNLGTLRA